MIDVMSISPSFIEVPYPLQFISGSPPFGELIHSDPICSILQPCAPSRCSDIHHLKNSALSKLLALHLLTIGKPFVPCVFFHPDMLLCKQRVFTCQVCEQRKHQLVEDPPGIHGKVGYDWECLLHGGLKNGDGWILGRARDIVLSATIQATWQKALIEPPEAPEG